MLSYIYVCRHVKYSLFWSYFSETWISSIDFRKILKYQISWKSVPWQPSCSVRTDATILIVAFRKFAKSVWKASNWEICGMCIRVFFSSRKTHTRQSYHTSKEKQMKREVYSACVCVFFSIIKKWTVIETNWIGLPTSKNLQSFHCNWALHTCIYSQLIN